MEIKDGIFYVVSIEDTQLLEQTRSEAIQKLVGLVKKTNGDIEDMKPEIIEVDTNGDKWQLKGLSWNVIALELMRANQK